MPHLAPLKRILGDALGISTHHLTEHSPLLGSVPELDSMAVLGVITAIEERFAISVDDDEISARHFETLGTLNAFVRQKTESGA